MNQQRSGPRIGNWFLSVTGAPRWPLDVRPGDVVPEEIAHSLGMICRFGGHCREFYSVAQHSVIISQQVPAEFAMIGLLHDATEIYLGDMIRPLKQSLPEYKAIENRVWAAIVERFGLALNLVDGFDLPSEVKEADVRMLQTERRDLLAPHTWAWTIDEEAIQPYDFTIEPWDPVRSRTEFMARFLELGGS